MGVQVVRCPWLQRKAIATADGFVGVDETADSRETRVVLEHEKQHFRQSAFYTLATDDIQRLRSEAKVNRALIRELCPYKTLRRLLRQGAHPFRDIRFSGGHRGICFRGILILSGAKSACFPWEIKAGRRHVLLFIFVKK